MMSLEKNKGNDKLKKNIISSALFQILVMIVPIITTPYVTRIFTPSQMGEYSLSATIAGFFVVIANFGLNLYGSREVAKTKTKKDRSELFFSLWSIQAFFSVIMFLIYNIVFLIIFKDNDRTLYVVQSFLIVINILDISWYFIGIEEIGKTIFRNMIMKVFTTISVFIFVQDKNHLYLYALINVIGILLGNITLLLASNKYIDFHYKRFHFKLSYINSSFKLLLPQIISSSFGTIERSILRAFSNNQSVGVYDQGRKIINLLFSVLSSSLSALMPRMSYHVSRNEDDKVRYYLNKGLIYTNFFSAVIVSSVLVVSNDFVSFFYGPSYDNVSIVMKITGLALLFIPTSVFLSSGLMIPLKKDRAYLISIVITVLTGLLLNLLLDYKLDILGASIAYVGAQAINYMYIIYSVKKYIKLKILALNFFQLITTVVITVFLMDIIISRLMLSVPFISFIIGGLGSILMSISLLFLSDKIKLFMYSK